MAELFRKQTTSWGIMTDWLTAVHALGLYYVLTKTSTDKQRRAATDVWQLVVYSEPPDIGEQEEATP